MGFSLFAFPRALRAYRTALDVSFRSPTHSSPRCTTLQSNLSLELNISRDLFPAVTSNSQGEQILLQVKLTERWPNTPNACNRTQTASAFQNHCSCSNSSDCVATLCCLFMFSPPIPLQSHAARQLTASSMLWALAPREADISFL